MKNIVFLFIFVFLFNCLPNPESYIEHLNGYWEIDEVTLPDGSKRDYNFNDTIDYWIINDSMTGFRKKLKPNFDGTYSTSDDAEALKLIIKNDSLYIYYKTQFDEWKEIVLKATEKQLIIQNKNNFRYTYKRYEPLDLK